MNDTQPGPLDSLHLRIFLQKVGVCSKDSCTAIFCERSNPVHIAASPETFFEHGGKFESLSEGDLLDRLNDRWSDMLVRPDPQLAVVISYSTAAFTASSLISYAAATRLMLPPSARHIR